MADHLAVPTSADTILRRVKQADVVPGPAPRFIGIDDWAWRKGKRYGTIVVDLERGQVIDVLPDRDAETVKKWLKDHPGVELLSRDRWSAYAQAASEAAPQARQVLDRWHLLKNLREAIEKLFERQAGDIKAALKPSVPTSGSVAQSTEKGEVTPTRDDETTHPLNDKSSIVSDGEDIEQSKRKRRVMMFESVRSLHRHGRSIRGITRDLGISRKLVRHYLRSEACCDLGSPRTRRSFSGLDVHQIWIDARLKEGCRNAAQLHRELIAMQGCKRSAAAVSRYVTKRLAALGLRRERVNAAKPPAVPTPSARQLSFQWIRQPEARKVEEQARIDAIRAHSPEIGSALEVADEFTKLVRRESSGTLSDWLARAEESRSVDVRRFAEGIRREEIAAHLGITEKWSNGPVEGQVNRLKMIKRQMYGRAGFELLRSRVINTN